MLWGNSHQGSKFEAADLRTICTFQKVQSGPRRLRENRSATNHAANYVNFGERLVIIASWLEELKDSQLLRRTIAKRELSPRCPVLRGLNLDWLNGQVSRH